MDILGVIGSVTKGVASVVDEVEMVQVCEEKKHKCSGEEREVNYSGCEER